MRLEHSGGGAKGWLAGPWNADLPAAVGYATEGVDEPHLHTVVTELYLVARGTATAQVEERTVELAAGDVMVVEPGEAHTFLASSDDYLHFVVHLPPSTAWPAASDKQAVPRSRRAL